MFADRFLSCSSFALFLCVQAYTLRAALQAKYPWFEKMHAMMTDCNPAGPAVLITTPAAQSDSDPDDQAELGSATTSAAACDAMDKSGDKAFSAGIYNGRNLSPLDSLVLGNPSTSTSTATVDPVPTPSQRRELSTSDVFTSSNSAASSHGSLNKERKCGALEQK